MNTDMNDIRDGLDRIVERVAEARATTELISEGDASALRELDAVVDDIAETIAVLKRQTARDGSEAASIRGVSRSSGG